VAQPTQLTPTEQDALVKQIGLAMLRVAPEDWEQLTVDYRAVGRYAESTGQVTFSDGGSEPWTMPADLQALFARLRAGMYREGRGTWFNARYRLDHPSSYNLEYDREEPNWDLTPPPQAYPDDMRMFPRSDENVPEWLRRRLAAAPPPERPPGPPQGPPPTPRFRVARIFDGPGEDGRPSVNRPPVDDMDIQDVLDYLDNAPLVGPARGYDVDRLDPNGQQSVPVAFHTDGTWIWPAAVNYYLREHDIAPEPDLVEHLRRMRFKLVPVDEQTRSAAQLFLSPPGPGPGGPGPGGPGPGPGGPGLGGPGPGPGGPGLGGPGGPPGGPRPGPPAPAPTRALPVPSPAPAPAPPRAALPSQGPASAQVAQLRERLTDLDVPETAYRIGAPAGRGWVMEQTDEGWRVGWHDRGDWVAPAVFEDVADASAFLLGKLLLDTDRWAAGPKNPELTPKAGAPAEDRGFQPEDRGFQPPEDRGFQPPEERGFQPADDRGFQPPDDRGFQPMSAPLEAFEPAPAPMEDYSPAGHAAPPPAGPVMPPPGTPGYTAPSSGKRALAEPASSSYSDSPSPLFADPSEGYTPPGRPQPQPTMAMEPQSPSRGFEPPAHGLESNGFDPSGRGLDSPPRGFESPGRGVDTPGRGMDALGRNPDTPGRGTDLPGRGMDVPGRGMDVPGRGLDSPPAHGMDSPPRGLDSPAHGMDSPPRGLDSPAHGMDSPPRGTELPSRGGDQATMLARPANGAASAPPGSEWPITPLPGEPPLTLFRGKRVIELEPGTEIDRFGDDDGNLVYSAGTPFAERSLVPEWIDRPYHVYRVRDRFQALTGAAIPWFDQPGGGTAFLLPDAIGDLVAQGHLVEVNDPERPPPA
jgi:hypothetical protein